MVGLGSSKDGAVSQRKKSGWRSACWDAEGVSVLWSAGFTEQTEASRVSLRQLTQDLRLKTC
jgi:hypothetical protein